MSCSDGPRQFLRSVYLRLRTRITDRRPGIAKRLALPYYRRKRRYRADYREWIERTGRRRVTGHFAHYEIEADYDAEHLASQTRLCWLRTVGGGGMIPRSPARLLRTLAAELVDWIDEVVRHVPGRAGALLRRVWQRHRLTALGGSAAFGIGAVVLGGENIRIGHHFRLMRNSHLYAINGRLQIGDRVSINANVLIDASAGGEIRIGHDVLIGPNVVLRASDHVFASRDRPINQQGHSGGSITLEDDVWIGANAVILPGVQIGRGAVVGAGAVIRRNVPPYALALGNPATIVRNWRGAAALTGTGVVRPTAEV